MKKRAKAKPIGCVCRKYDISQEELSCEYGENTMYEFIKEQKLSAKTYKVTNKSVKVRCIQYLVICNKNYYS